MHTDMDPGAAPHIHMPINAHMHTRTWQLVCELSKFPGRVAELGTHYFLLCIPLQLKPHQKCTNAVVANLPVHPLIWGSSLTHTHQLITMGYERADAPEILAVTQSSIPPCDVSSPLGLQLPWATQPAGRGGPHMPGSHMPPPTVVDSELCRLAVPHKEMIFSTPVVVVAIVAIAVVAVVLQ